MVSAKRTRRLPLPSGSDEISRAFDRTVSDFVGHNGDAEARFQVGFVPAREGPPGVSGLELGGGQPGLFAVVPAELAAVKATQQVIELAREAQVQRVGAGFQRAGGHQDGLLLLGDGRRPWRGGPPAVRGRTELR